MAEPRLSSALSHPINLDRKSWQRLYMDAVLECESITCQPCAKRARDAIKTLITSNTGQISSDELTAMRNALDVLDILYKMPNEIG
jgi:hypothetical protein